MVFYEKEFVLSKENIGIVVQSCVEEYEKAVGYRKKAVLNLSLSLEEILLDFSDCYGEQALCTVLGIKNRGGVRFKLINRGQPLNPLTEDNEMGEYSREILERLGFKPSYSYKQKIRQNEVSLPGPVKPDKNRNLYMMLGAIALAVATFFILRMFPENVGEFFAQGLVNPIFTKITNVISAIATPLVFLSVIDGITGLGNSNAIGVIGKKLIKNMFITYAVAAVALSFFACLFYPVSKDGVGGENVFAQLTQLVLDVIPDNLLECFVIDNDLQVIVLAIFIGIVLVMMGQKGEKITEGVSIVSQLVNNMMSIVCKLLPGVVYLGILNLLLRDMSDFSKIYKVGLVFILACAMVIAFLLIKAKLITKISMVKIFKYQLKTLLVNLTTSSQVAALPENSRCCKTDFGINSRLVDFSLPLYIVTYMPCGTCFIGLTAWSLAEISGTPVDISVIIKIAMVSVIIGIAAPPIPGSAFAVLPILFSSCGISLEFYSVAIILGTVIGYFLPAFNGYCMQLDLLITAKQLDMIDEEKQEALKPNKGRRKS